VRPHRKDNPSSIFYWKDYENDEGLRVSSLAAQGLWMRLLCVAAKADPYGYILVNGFPLEATGAARLAGVTEGEAQSLIQELERNGVFSRDRKGRMFSRRMVRDATISAKAKKNGSKGGNPALNASIGNQKEKIDPVNHPLNPPLKPPYPLPHSQEKNGGGGSACARDPDPPDPKIGNPTPEPTPPDDPTDRERLLVAMGHDPSGMTANGRLAGNAADKIEWQRWMTDLGLSMPEILAVITETVAAKRDGPPVTFSYFTGPMARFAAAKRRPVLQPATGGYPDAPRQHSPAAIRAAERTAAIAAGYALADRQDRGEIDIRPASRDPF
jgi:hypothetical protein